MINCDDCPYLANCVFDDDSLTEAQQDAKCPEVGAMPDPDPDPLSDKAVYVAWRTGKLKEIKEMLPEDGVGIKFKDLVSQLGVQEKTLRSWYLYFMDGEIRSTHKTHKWRVLWITSVSLTRKDRRDGHLLAAREQQLELADKIIKERGPVPVMELCDIVGVTHSTIRYWIGKWVKSKTERVLWKGKYRQIIYITGIIT